MSNLVKYKKLPRGVPAPKSKKGRIRKKWFRRYLQRTTAEEAMAAVLAINCGQAFRNVSKENSLLKYLKNKNVPKWQYTGREFKAEDLKF